MADRGRLRRGSRKVGFSIGQGGDTYLCLLMGGSRRALGGSSFPSARRRSKHGLADPVLTLSLCLLPRCQTDIVVPLDVTVLIVALDHRPRPRYVLAATTSIPISPVVCTHIFLFTLYRPLAILSHYLLEHLYVFRTIVSGRSIGGRSASYSSRSRSLRWPR